MRVILDTNVLLAALISTKGAPNIIYRAWREARFELVTSTMQLDELKRVSRYPKLKAILPAHRIGTLINNLQQTFILDALPVLPKAIAARDPDDNFLLAMSLVGKADWLVTGDGRAELIQRGNLGRTRIATPAAFCAKALRDPNA